MTILLLSIVCGSGCSFFGAKCGGNSRLIGAMIPHDKAPTTHEWRWVIAFPDTEQLCAVLAKGLFLTFLLLCCGGPSGYTCSCHIHRNKWSRR